MVDPAQRLPALETEDALGVAHTPQKVFRKTLILSAIVALLLPLPAWAVGVVPNRPPQAGTFSPTNDSSFSDEWVVLTTVYTDPDGWQNLTDVRLLINTRISARDAAYLRYDRSQNRLYLLSDDGRRWLGGVRPGTRQPPLENTQVRLDVSGTTVTGSSRTLTVRWRVSFKEDFAGNTYNAYLWARDRHSATSGWVKRSTWTVQAQPDGEGESPGDPTRVIRATTPVSLDVTRDGVISSLDVLTIISYLNSYGSGPVPEGQEHLDVNRDGTISPLDVLIIINYLNNLYAILTAEVRLTGPDVSSGAQVDFRWVPASAALKFKQYRWRLKRPDDTFTPWIKQAQSQVSLADEIAPSGTYAFELQAQYPGEYWSGTMQHSFTIDRTAPSTPWVTDDGFYTASTTQLHATWTSTDPESAIVEYQYAIGTTPGGINILSWTSTAATEITKTGFALTQGASCYVSVKARNGAGLWSEVGSSDGILVDATAPTPPVVVDDGDETPDLAQLHAAWTSSDPESGIVEYQYAIGTTSGGIDIVSWTLTDAATEMTRTGLSLVDKTTYYISVKALNGAGLWSAVGVSDGILVSTNRPPTLEPIGDKLIRVFPPEPEPPPSGSQPEGEDPEAAAASPELKALEEPVLILKLAPELSPQTFEDYVHSGQRLRRRGSPHQLRRILGEGEGASQGSDLSRGTTQPLRLWELCARYRAKHSKSLFKPRRQPKGRWYSRYYYRRFYRQPSRPIDRIVRLKLDCSRAELAQAVAEFSQDPQVVYCEPRMMMRLFQTPNDPYLTSSGSWDQSYPDLWGLKRIQAEAAWDITAGSPDVVVAVIDTGIDSNHSDLFPNLWRNDGEVPANGWDDDGNGFADDTWGWDFVDFDDGEQDPDPSDGHGHGTHVAGTIAAVGNNAQGIIGVAWQAKVMALKGLSDQGYGASDDLAQAIQYAADNGADVVNMSWGGSGRSQVIEDAVRYAHDKGVVLVAAAGNDNVDASFMTPANIEEVITVAATDHTDHKAAFSNWGSKIDVAAPGGDSTPDLEDSNRTYANILSCRARGTDMYGDGLTLLGDYARARGTSMAAPHVAGLCALILANHPEFTNEGVRQILRASADDILDPLNDGSSRPGFDIYTGAGRVNATRALEIDQADLPVAKIAEPFSQASLAPEDLMITVRGTATGLGPQGYLLEYGRGEDPEEWTLISSSDKPVNEGVLGSWDVSNLMFGPYTLRLTVDSTFPGLMAQDQILTRVRPPLLQGWPVELPKNRFERISLYGKAVEVEDLDGDGKSEIVVSDKANLLYVFEHNGQMRKNWPVEVVPISSFFSRLGDPEIADLDGDGDAEILVSSFESAHKEDKEGVHKVWVFQHDGTIASGWPVQDLKRQNGVVDLNGDRRLEIFVLEYAPIGSQGKRTVLGHDGKPFMDWPHEIFERRAIVSANDLDGDGEPELLGRPLDATGTPSQPGLLYAWRRDGSALPGWPIEAQSIGPLVDVDGDGALDVIVYPGGSISVVRHDGTALPGWPRSIQLDSPTLINFPADLDGDGGVELIGKGRYRYGVQPLIIWDSDGTEILRDRDTYARIGLACAGDLDGNQRQDILFSHALYWQTFNEGIFAIDESGSLLEGWPILFKGIYPVAIDDMDDNGTLEVIALQSPYRKLDNDSDHPGEFYRVIVWDLPAPYDSNLIDWPTDAHDSRHTNTLPLRNVDGKRGLLVIKLQASDPDPDQLVFSIEGLPEGAFFNPSVGFFRWQPTMEQEGVYQVTFTVSDGEESVSETITITVRAGNDPPQLTLPVTSYTINETELLEFTLEGSDPDSDRVQFIGYDLPRGASLNRQTGEFTWRPDFTQAGEYLLSVAASDGSLEDRQTIKVTVNNVNRAPELTKPASVTMEEGEIVEFLLDAIDPDGEPLTFSAANLPPDAIFVPETGLFSWQPTFEQAGSYGPIEITVSDGDLSDTESFTITVENVAPWTTPPGIGGLTLDAIASPTNVTTQVIGGTKPAYTAILVNGVEMVSRDRLTIWSAEVALSEGSNPLAIRLQDVAGLASSALGTTIVLDTIPPAITVTSPNPGEVIPLTASEGES